MTLRIPDMVEPGLPDRSALIGVIELLRIIGEQEVETGSSRIGEHRSVLLSTPLEVTDVVEALGRRQMPENR